MGNTPRVGDLEVMQDLDFEHRSWSVQRIAWIILSLILAAAFLGLMGEGPLSGATAGAADAPFQVRYGRFVRHRGSTQMEIQLQPGAVQGDEVRVWVDREYLSGVELRQVVPEPDSVEAGQDRLVYVWKLNEPGAGTGFIFDLMPVQNGIRDVRIGLEDGPEVSFTQVVWP